MSERLDFATDDRVTGYRLDYFEFYNWGTYNEKITKLALNGENALLTGDIGSGKSTIVDAITTILVPTNKITYNKAAGANAKERTLYSYIVGEYKTTQDEQFGRAKAVSLRDESKYTVLIAKFNNVGFGEHIFLAQFFYIVNRQVHRFFVVSKGELSIKQDFVDFKDVRELKKRLRAKNHTFVYDSFKDYSKYFRKEMGLRSEQALNLFYQTVSLKAIGNLTQFIRSHMLEDFKIDEKIDEICINFAELNTTYNLVLKAKREIELLTPIDKEFKEYQRLQSHKDKLSRLKELVICYISHFEKELLEKKLDELNIDLTTKESTKKSLNETIKDMEQEIINIKMELQNSGANRLNEIEREINSIANLMKKVKRTNQKYNEIIKKLGFSSVSNESRFLKVKEELSEKFNQIDDKKIKLQNTIMLNSVTLHKYQEQIDDIESEISYLEKKPSNIPLHISKIRDELSKALEIDSSELPFVGELIRIKDEAWAGAIERVLHNFALSILVDRNYYDRVSEYIDNTYLRGKIVYLNVKQNEKYSKDEEIYDNSLLHKIEIKADSSYSKAVKSMLFDKFNIPCVDSIDEFRRYKRALSINGQIKLNFTKHEKDDRFDINDKRRWVLGWDNFDKLETLKEELSSLREKFAIVNSEKEEFDKELVNLEKIRDRLRDALKYESFEEIDWYRYSKKIEELEDEKSELLKSSDIIKTLQDRLTKLELNLQEKKRESDKIIRAIGALENKISKRKEELDRADSILQNCTIDDSMLEQLEELKNSLELKINLNSLQSSQREMRENLQKKIDSLSKKMHTIESKIVNLQSDYKKEFIIESKEFLVDIDSSKEYVERLKKLLRDNLPEYESKFKRLFKEKSIQDIVMLQSRLEELSIQITDKIEMINSSLREIEYNEGTFIELIATKTKHKDIKEFRESLKLITTGAIDENNEYNEEKFIRLKELIDRFNGREGYSDIDKKWRKFVSDVRNWYEFSAVERYISDNEIKEYYEDSGGKSGGQKEKLAYTVLASSLAYQFGVEPDKIQSHSFRFVMIDEAFGRGSDESTRYALKLFEKLKLQLLVITPKQKINVIEPFVKSVHFVSNRDGMDSRLITLTIEEYQKQKSSS